ncbi:xanthine dehydrogenase family protein molybdopterin-binding subunit [Mycolicibacterium canariasense]|uniref:xanthine dehydrogenase family protein molybdopterin-binding subunit n=1 Tax=Mycolicibacterium canariasense TaxID=228230 RepID=UPI0007872E46|nr:xanthine dehydrogenase family protein molybdopterin-binding subunit [Mycolicibacterium canariasense]MCV7208081.1 xanthine dehydrogenase family protein molybdopterin-binding subunit [Mycolicibacterium canariasense]ORV09569.1 hypothetical protein AWB94_09990 [Mycolicibacterium canariasense]
MNHIGAAVPRRGGGEKASGGTRYAADGRHSGLAHAVLVTSTITTGRITAMDLTAAEAVPGLLGIITHHSDVSTLTGRFVGDGGQFHTSRNPLGGPLVYYHGQVIAVVVAETREAAEEAASRIATTYTQTPARASLTENIDRARQVPSAGLNIGDVDRAMADAAQVVTTVIDTPAMHHHPIEPYTTTAQWRGGRLRVELPSQWVTGARAGLAETFGLHLDRVEVSSPHVGGAFGSKAWLMWHTVFAAAAARSLRRPVRLSVSRSQMFTVGPFRPQSRQFVRVGATADGKLVGYEHVEYVQTSHADDNRLSGARITSALYDVDNIRVSAYVVPTDVNTPGSMRGPHEYGPVFALECAIDELAERCGMDPVEFRLHNDTPVNRADGLPFSSRSLDRCLRRGAALFGWDDRSMEPGTMSDGDALIGWGCATSIYPVLRAPAEVAVRLEPGGTVRVSAGGHELGTGASTVLAQILADAVGCTLDDTAVELGDSRLPPGPMTAGSSNTGSIGPAVWHAGVKARTMLLTALAARLGVTPDLLNAREGAITCPARSFTFAEAMAEAGLGTICADHIWAPTELDTESVASGLGGREVFAPPTSRGRALYTFGAQFAEVAVDRVTRVPRVRRMVGVFDCGRIVNPRTARAQLVGGMIWGAGHALFEESVVDAAGRFAGADLGAYHFAVNADVGDVHIETIDSPDEFANELGVKGVGEIGVLGAAAAVANAVYHATGTRVRKTPILVDDLIP